MHACTRQSRAEPTAPLRMTAFWKLESAASSCVDCAVRSAVVCVMPPPFHQHSRQHTHADAPPHTRPLPKSIDSPPEEGPTHPPMLSTNSCSLALPCVSAIEAMSGSAAPAKSFDAGLRVEPPLNVTVGRSGFVSRARVD